MSKYNAVDNSTHTYLDINICNNNVSQDNSNPIPIIFNTQRDQNYIQDCSLYYMSCIRWNLDLSLPIIIPQIDLTYNNGEFDPAIGGYKTIYSVTIQIKTTTHTIESQKFIVFVPQQFQIPHPKNPITSMAEVYNNRYFYIESVQYWMKLVNTALREAFDDAKAQWNTSIGPLPIPDVDPFMLYNYDGNFTFNASPSFLTDTPPASGIGIIYFNTAMYGLFNGFSAIINGFDNASLEDVSNGKNVAILFESQYQTTVFNTVNYIYALTEYPCVPFFSPISSIVFTTNGIPVEPTNTMPCQITGVPAQLGLNNNNLNYQSVITDFALDLTTGIEGRTITGYIPSGEYRFFDLNSTRGLGVLNIQVQWKDKLTGSFHPVYLRAGGAGSLKLLFRKKNFFSNN
jgi:hypothetical protein